MTLTSSMEDYLEAVLVLQKKYGAVRCVDVSMQLGVTKPSVSRAVKELTKMGYLVKQADGTLSLTETGYRIANLVYEKHQFFTHQLIKAGVPEDVATQDACRLEHVISETSYRKLKEAALGKDQGVILSDE
ncbi:metal-dependent transcriptional regulator [Lachnospiraceae bacterium KGMB03038]|nr:metal-dependent transcriptional regulator [Lachnospiraceae bacterium KGMB03038]